MLDLLSDNIESNSLGEWSALSDSDNITSGETEGWGAVSSNGIMALLKSVVFLDVMEIVTTNYNGVLHFSGDHDTPK